MDRHLGAIPGPATRAFIESEYLVTEVEDLADLDAARMHLFCPPWGTSRSKRPASWTSSVGHRPASNCLMIA